MKRTIITIDENKCTGCALCIPGCPEGAIQIIDGKARLVSDLFCDGLGACIGHCPENAISTEVRESQPYSERLVMERVAAQGENTIRAHLLHLAQHGEEGYLAEARRYLAEKGIRVSIGEEPSGCERAGGCPGAENISFEKVTRTKAEDAGPESKLGHWPVQLHLVSPMATVFREKDVLLAADCVAYAMGDFHRRFLEGKMLAIACPKLDSGREIYLEKLKALIDHALIATLTVITMEVPCCSGLLVLAREAQAAAERTVPFRHVVVSVKGEILKEE